MGRRAFREKRSKFSGTKQVLQNLNQAAHAVVHDLDVSLPSGGGGGYVLFWSSNTFMHADDLSTPIYVPTNGTISLVYASLPLPALNDFEVDVFLNGTTIFTTPGSRPKVLTGDTFSADAVPDLTIVNARDVFEVQILDPGNGNYGRAMVYIVIA